MAKKKKKRYNNFDEAIEDMIKDAKEDEHDRMVRFKYGGSIDSESIAVEMIKILGRKMSNELKLRKWDGRKWDGYDCKSVLIH